MDVKVKICGITNLADAAAAVEAGADALGFMFYKKSPRAIAPIDARNIIRQLPAAVQKFGVFVDSPSCDVLEVLELTGITVLQFHGSEEPAFCRSFRMPVVKAFRIKDESSLAALPMYGEETWLLDSYVAGAMGGTGARFNWDLAMRAGDSHHPFYLAGGLTPENVAEAVRTVRPFGLDVSSGVESAPGKKDSSKVAAFIRAARG